MAGILQMDPAAEAALQNYPAEHKYVRWGTTGSIGLHILFVTVVLILAYLNHIRSLRDLMSGTIAQAAQPPDEIEIVLPQDDTPPPPTDHIEFIKQIIIPPNAPPPPPPPKPKPKPKNAPLIQHHYAASPKPAQLAMGSGDLPVPTYPMEERRNHIEGTVLVSVSFDSSGGVENVEVIKSSGSGALDEYTRHFIMENWHKAALAGKVGTVPVQYVLTH